MDHGYSDPTNTGRRDFVVFQPQTAACIGGRGHHVISTTERDDQLSVGRRRSRIISFSTITPERRTFWLTLDLINVRTYVELRLDELVEALSFDMQLLRQTVAEAGLFDNYVVQNCFDQ